MGDMSRLEDLVGMIEQEGQVEGDGEDGAAPSRGSSTMWAHAERFAEIQRDVVGHGAPVSTPFGSKALLYADWAASGRALSSIEEFIAREVLPLYGNTHTSTSACGLQVHPPPPSHMQTCAAPTKPTRRPRGHTAPRPPLRLHAACGSAPAPRVRATPTADRARGAPQASCFRSEARQVVARFGNARVGYHDQHADVVLFTGTGACLPRATRATRATCATRATRPGAPAPRDEARPPGPRRRHVAGGGGFGCSVLTPTLRRAAPARSHTRRPQARRAP
jgi:hypothetical protein